MISTKHFLFILLSIFTGRPAAALAADQEPRVAFHLLDDLRASSDYFIDREGLIYLASGAGASLLAHTEDGAVRSYFAHQNRLQGWDRLGNNYLGTGIPGVLLATGLWVYGDLKNHAYEVNVGQAMLESIVVTAIATDGLKGVTDRERPDGSDHYSFPSGHTSTVFAVAQVLEDAYGWTIGVPAYAIGVLTAAGRMSADVHWFSDTVAGAALGIAIGHSFSRVHFGKFSQGAVQVFPVLAPGSVQLALVKEF